MPPIRRLKKHDKGKERQSGAIMPPNVPNGVEGLTSLKPVEYRSPHRPRHQITRSISELPSSLHLHRHRSHRDRPGKEKEKDKDKQYKDKAKHKYKDRERDREKGKDRDGLNLETQSANPTLQSNARSRFSLEGFGMSTPNNLTPNASRRASILNTSPSGDDSVPSVATAALTSNTPDGKVLLKEDEIAKERQKAIAREKLVENIPKPPLLVPFMSGFRRLTKELPTYTVA